MAKQAPDAMIDGGLSYLQASDMLLICSDEPTTWEQATGTYLIADVALTSPGDLPIANDASGRKCTIAAKSAIPVTHSATATHVVLAKRSDNTVRGVTTCTSQALTSGGTVDAPAWKWNIQDPS